MKLKRILIAVVVCVLLLGGLTLMYYIKSQRTRPNVIHVINYKDLPKELQKKEINNQLRTVFIRDIDVSGQVVDEHGALLNDVDLLMDVHVSGVGTKRHKKVLKDGQFSFKFSGCMALDLYFNKPGHYERKIVFSPHSPNDTRPPKWNEVVEGNRIVIREKELSVELESLGGDWNTMDKYDVRCTFSTNGLWKGTVFLPNPEYTEDTRKTRSMKPFLTKVVEFPADQIPENCIYITAPVDESGKIKAVTETFWVEDKSFGYEKSISPQKIDLSIAGEENGFVQPNLKMIDLQRYSGQWVKLMTRQLKTAPKEGYLSVVPVEPSPKFTRRFFFVKALGSYGRLSVEPPTSIAGGTIECRLELYLQPNGSRDVRSMDGAQFKKTEPKVEPKQSEPSKKLSPYHLNYNVAGKVVDQDGKTLNNYEILSFTSMTGTTQRKDSFKDAFSLIRAGTSLTMIISKKGYYPKKLMLDGFMPETLVPVDAVKSGKTVNAPNMVVELEETGPITRLSTVSVFPGDVYFNVDKGSKGLFIKKEGSVVRALPESVKIPPNFPPEESVMYFRATETGGKIKVPLDIKLGIGGKGNGLIMFEPKGGSQQSKMLLRELKDAPENGYKAEIEIDATKEHNFFFFKFDGFYGKGYLISRPESSTDGKTLLAGMILYFQPNGSRNVRTK